MNRNKCQQLDNNEGDQKRRELLTPSEMKQLIVGTKFHRRLPSTSTLQEHQNILKNVTVSRDSDIENVLGQWKNIYFKTSSLFQ